MAAQEPDGAQFGQDLGVHDFFHGGEDFAFFVFEVPAGGGQGAPEQGAGFGQGVGGADAGEAAVNFLVFVAGLLEAAQFRAGKAAGQQQQIVFHPGVLAQDSFHQARQLFYVSQMLEVAQRRFDFVKQSLEHPVFGA